MKDLRGYGIGVLIGNIICTIFSPIEVTIAFGFLGVGLILCGRNKNE